MVEPGGRVRRRTPGQSHRTRLPPETWTTLDHEMIQCAKNRGMVELDNGYVVLLVAWRPGDRPTARVTYPSNKSARIPGTRIVRTIEDWSISTPERTSRDVVRES
jgi:hypothetical protein